MVRYHDLGDDRESQTHSIFFDVKNGLKNLLAQFRGETPGQNTPRLTQTPDSPFEISGEN